MSDPIQWTETVSETHAVCLRVHNATLTTARAATESDLVLALKSLDANALSRVLGGITDPLSAAGYVRGGTLEAERRHELQLRGAAEATARIRSERDAAIRERDITQEKHDRQRTRAIEAEHQRDDAVRGWDNTKEELATVTKERDEARMDAHASSAAGQVQDAELKRRRERIAALTEELTTMRPVVEAAKSWRKSDEWSEHPTEPPSQLLDTLADAVDALATDAEGEDPAAEAYCAALDRERERFDALSAEHVATVEKLRAAASRLASQETPPADPNERETLGKVMWDSRPHVSEWEELGEHAKNDYRNAAAAVAAHVRAGRASQETAEEAWKRGAEATRESFTITTGGLAWAAEHPLPAYQPPGREAGK